MENQGRNQPAEQAGEQKRISRRSPNFPYIPLSDALSKTRVIAGLEHQHPADPAVILKHLGYKEKMSGSGGRTIAALRQYGLLEENNNQLRVSDFAYQLIHLPGGSGDVQDGIKKAALNPNIFRELYNNYSGNLPSDENLRSYLILKRGFNPRSVDDFIQVFRATIGYASLTPGEQGLPVQQQAPGGTMETLEQEGARQPGVSRRIVEMVGKTAPDFIWTWTLSIPRNVNVEVRLSGDVRPGDFDQLKAYVDSLKSVFEDDSS